MEGVFIVFSPKIAVGRKGTRRLRVYARRLRATLGVAKMASHAIFQYNVLVIDIDNTTLGLI